MNIDQRLFAELDKHSGNLRAAALELAILLVELNNQTHEIQQLIRTLKTIETAPIERMDTAIADVRDSYLALNTAISENRSGLEPHILSKIITYNDKLVRVARELEKKAIEINKLCEDDE